MSIFHNGSSSLVKTRFSRHGRSVIGRNIILLYIRCNCFRGSLDKLQNNLFCIKEFLAEGFALDPKMCVVAGSSNKNL